jgi:hypothetical protein
LVSDRPERRAIRSDFAEQVFGRIEQAVEGLLTAALLGGMSAIGARPAWHAGIDRR